MKHVVQLVYALGIGGSEMLASAIATTGVRLGVRMSLCGLYPGDDLAWRLRQSGVEAHALAKRDGIQPRTVVSAARLFRRLQPTTVITHHLGQLLYGALGARLCGAQLIHVEHERYSLSPRRARRLLRVFSALADVIVVPARDTARFLERHARIPARKICVIPNGIDLQRFVGRARPPADRPVIGTVGRLDPAKDHLTMLAAFRQILARVPDAQLVIVGEGDNRPAIEAYIRDHGLTGDVRLEGSRRDVELVLPGFDVFLLSSTQEGVPIALLEAMACRVPVVATDVGAVRETLADGTIGRLVPARDASALAAAVVDMLTDRAAAARLASAGRRRVEDEHDVVSTVAAYLALCKAPRGCRGPHRRRGRSQADVHHAFRASEHRAERRIPTQ